MGTLFRHEDGRSIVFAMQPCEEKAEIRPLIEVMPFDALTLSDSVANFLTLYLMQLWLMYAL